MKSRFMTIAICLVLIVTSLPLADISPSGEPVYAALIGTNPASPDVAYQADTSPYDGTYAGTFNYEYQQRTLNPNYPATSKEKYTLSPKVQASFTLTVTFETFPSDLYKNSLLSKLSF